MLTDKPERSQAVGGAAQHSHPSLLRLMLQPSIVRSALKVSLVVGTVLNVINNGEQIWTFHTVTLWRFALNFVVPYCVSSYSAARNQAQHSQWD